MLDTFERKETKLQERRAARQRQMRLMEEASSGILPPPASDKNAAAAALTTTTPDVDNREGRFSIDDGTNEDDDDDEDDGGLEEGGYDSEEVNDGPPSVFTDASTHLWNDRSATGGGTAAAVGRLDAEKLSFITGGDDDDDDDDDDDAVAGGGWGGDGTTRARRRTAPYANVPARCAIHRRALIASAMLLTLLIVLLAVVSEEKGNSPPSSSSPSSSPSRPSPWEGGGGGGGGDDPWGYDPPPDDGGGGGPDAERFERIKDRILERGISAASSLELSYTPQRRALSWLVRDDPRRLDVPRGDGGSGGATMSGADVDAERSVFQRYALAVLWYQTTDLGAVQMSATGRDVVDPFDVPYNPMDLTRDDIRWTDDENWMSGRGLCLWRGVTCHPGRRPGSDPGEMYVPEMATGGHDGGGTGGAGAGRYDGDFYVRSLNLTGNNVYGVVPREVYTAFDKLISLDLSRNALEGTIGREVGSLLELEGRLFVSFFTCLLRLVCCCSPTDSYFCFSSRMNAFWHIIRNSLGNEIHDAT